MKLSKLFFGLATAAMFAACSSDDIVAEQPQIQWNEDGMGYMAFNVTMPEQVSNRAENDKFGNGDVKEYAVKNVTLLLFDGTKFHSAYNLGDDAWTGANTDTNPNVTADNKFIAKVKGEGIANPYAFVVLNHNGIFSVDPANHTLNINGANIAAGAEFSTIQALTAKSALDLEATAFHKDDANGFLMMNAPLMSEAGGAVVPTGAEWTLTKVNTDAIYTTEAAAAAGTGAASVYVERAVAKVTLTTEATITTSTPDFTNAVVTGWTLDNTNKHSYLVRQEADFNSWLGYNAPGTVSNNKYRMVGTTTVGHDAPVTEGTAGADAYRTYWAKDVNYARTALSTPKTDPNYATDLLAWQSARYAEFNPYTAITKPVGESMYCAENTFDVDHMVYGETTRALVAVKLTPATGTDFYSRPGDNKVYSEAQMINAAQAWAVSVLGAHTAALSGTPSYTVTKETTDGDFKVVVTGLTYTGSDTEVQALLSTAGKVYNCKEFGYTFYKGGVCYYDVRIKHFGDECTPWGAHDAANVNESYYQYADGSAVANPENDFLGRWGVLRNNWYNLNITSILKVGYADPADLDLDPTTTGGYDPETPDDNQKSEQWIAVDVNILSWAKRFQNVEF